MTPPASDAARDAPGTSLDWATLAAQMQHEDEGILFPLLDRMEDLSRRLDREERVDPDYLDAFVGLWSRYVEGLHRRRVVVLGELTRPMLGERKGPAHRLRFGRHAELVYSDEGRSDDTPLGQYDRIARDQERTAQRIGVIQSLIRDYRRGQYMSRQLLASLLRSSAFADRAWARYEESFARSNLTGSPGSASPAATPAPDPEFEKLGAEVRAFLARPVPSQPPAAKT